MKRFVCFILSFLILFGFTINSFAYKIDGIKKRTEWENSDIILLLDKEESNNNISFGLVNWAIEDRSLFLCFDFIEKTVPEDFSLSGISLIIDDSEEFIVTVETSPAESDSTEYHFEGAVSYDAITGSACEIRVGSKYGWSEEISAKARFIDSNGSYSNVYDFTIQNSTNEFTPYYPEDTPESPKITTTKNSQTTKPVTSVTAKPEKTTKKPSSKTTKKNDSGLFDFIFKDKEETTTKQSKPAKTTRKSSDKTKKTTEKHKKATNNQTNSASIPTSIIYVSSSSDTADITNRISTTEGTKYKLLTAVFGGITIVTVAILGTIGANKKANKKNNKDE